MPASLALLALLALPAGGKSWCAAPLVVHEWGVQVYRGPGATPQAVPLPPWFHSQPAPRSEPVEPVRSLPADGGERELPVIQVYTPRAWGDVPFALELGLPQGRPSSWYPQADRVSPPRPPGDPGVQLAWDALTLSAEPRGTPQASNLGWVAGLRAVEGALWVARGEESERFLYYEATTREQPAVVLAGGRVHNRSRWPVHDLVVVQRGPGGARIATLETLAPGAEVALELRPAADPVATLGPWLAARLLVPGGIEALEAWAMDMDDCVMMRDPAEPTRAADDHRLYAAEIAVLMDTWQERFFGAEGTTLLYREDPTALDALAPLALYTDMRHDLELSRAGFVLWEGLGAEAVPGE